jgi:hypothetical protein
MKNPQDIELKRNGKWSFFLVSSIHKYITVTSNLNPCYPNVLSVKTVWKKEVGPPKL